MKRWKRNMMVAGAVWMLAALMSVSALASGLTAGQAVRTALGDAGLKKSQVRHLDAELERGVYEIEFTKKKDKTEYEYEIEAGSGVIREVKIEIPHRLNTSKEKIGKAEARRQAARFTGCRLKKVRAGSCRYKKDGREWIYKMKFRQGRYQYEVEVLASSGKVVEMEKERR